jgi:hypothetical protein
MFLDSTHGGVAWHYVPVLARKHGALRNGAPFKDWVLGAGCHRVGARDRDLAPGLAGLGLRGLPIERLGGDRRAESADAQSQPTS